jgi:hypothetical protein
LSGEKVYVIRNAIDTQANTSESADDAADIFIQPELAFRRDQWPTFARVENDVVDQTCIGFWHERHYTAAARIRELWGWFGTFPPGLYAAAVYDGFRKLSATGQKLSVILELFADCPPMKRRQNRKYQERKMLVRISQA